MRLRELLFAVKFGALLPAPAAAHVSEQGFVLLLPTGAYTAAGVAVVALTVLALFAMPERAVRVLFAVRPVAPWAPRIGPTVTSLMSMCLMLFAVYSGLFGPRNPLSNIMPLSFWTLGWILTISLAGLVGNLWVWINPWTGLCRLLGLGKPLVQGSARLKLWPATVLLIAFAAFLLADPAPDDPTRLAQLVAAYWGAAFLGRLLFGQAWLERTELGYVLFAALAHLAPLRLRAPAGVGGPGWQVVHQPQTLSAGVFALTFLGVGSFDGLNETFWWLARIGVNPLEFPGRSAVIGATLSGLIGCIVALVAVFAAVVWLGLTLSRADVPYVRVFGPLALSVLPIALVYHMAHYLTAFMVGIQYTVAAVSDPFATGADWLGVQPFLVSTGFFNRIDQVRLIWLTQATLVVVGHVWSVLLAHRIAMDIFGDHRRAAVATLPLSGFMIFYTFLGLWLLAAPKGA